MRCTYSTQHWNSVCTGKRWSCLRFDWPWDLSASRPVRLSQCRRSQPRQLMLRRMRWTTRQSRESSLGCLSSGLILRGSLDNSGLMYRSDNCRNSMIRLWKGIRWLRQLCRSSSRKCYHRSRILRMIWKLNFCSKALQHQHLLNHCYK